MTMKKIILDGIGYVRADSIPVPIGDVKIVILQRGWVFVGRLSKDDEQYTLNNAKVVRVWGTSKGLGEIALNGPTTKTILDPAGTVEFHALTVVAILNADESKWEL